jgi:DNA invertase Pin-like site-specific DNA recombinase
MRAVIYARYSSDLQSASSAEDQIAICKQRIAREGWTLAGVFLDEGISGVSTLRSGYQSLLQVARTGGCDVVVAEALDRISRDQEHVAALFKQMIFAGVRIVTLAEGEIGELHVGLKGTMNALFLKDLADKTRRGLKGRVEKGQSPGGLCFGYSVRREVALDGTPIRGGRVIDETQAVIVRQLFVDFAAGKSPRKIAFDLNDRGIPGPRHSAWGPSTIYGNRARGTGILNNELYMGKLVWNRLRYMKDPDTGKRCSRANTDDALVVHEVPELGIIDEALWQAVKARQTALALDTRPDVASTPKPFHQQPAQVPALRPDPVRPLWRRLRQGGQGPLWLCVRPQQGRSHLHQHADYPPRDL